MTGHENLCRAELTAAQRSAAIKRRKEIWEALNMNSGTTCPTIPASRGRPEEFAAATASASGMTKRSIDENLCRAELTAAQRSAAIKRRKEIWEALNLNSGQTLATIPAIRGRPAEFASATAAASGMAKSSINQHLARAEALGDDLQAVVGTSLDKGVELDALKAMMRKFLDSNT